eukprot:Em0001g2152a
MNTPDSANLRSVGSPTMPLEPANSINSESQAPPGHHSESQAQAEPTEQIGHPLHVEEPVVCDSNPRVPSVLVTGQSASSVDFELKSWGRESPHSCTPSQEMEGYSDAPSRRCRTQSAPINEYTSGGVTRMLPMPSTQAECDRNHEIMKEFFDTYLVELPEEDFAFLGMKLLDCEYDKLLSNYQHHERYHYCTQLGTRLVQKLDTSNRTESRFASS